MELHKSKAGEIIKYLQKMHDANVGDVKTVTAFEANILIKTGVAKPHKPTRKKDNDTQPSAE